MPPRSTQPIPWAKPTAQQLKLWGIGAELLAQLDNAFAEGWISPLLIVLDGDGKEIWRTMFAEGSEDSGDSQLAELIESKVPEAELFGWTRIDLSKPRVILWTRDRSSCVTVDLEIEDQGTLMPFPHVGDLAETFPSGPKGDAGPLPVVRTAESY